MDDKMNFDIMFWKYNIDKALVSIQDGLRNHRTHVADSFAFLANLFFELPSSCDEEAFNMIDIFETSSIVISCIKKFPKSRRWHIRNGFFILARCIKIAQRCSCEGYFYTQLRSKEIIQFGLDLLKSSKYTIGTCTCCDNVHELAEVLSNIFASRMTPLSDKEATEVIDYFVLMTELLQNHEDVHTFIFEHLELLDRLIANSPNLELISKGWISLLTTMHIRIKELTTDKNLLLSELTLLIEYCQRKGTEVLRRKLKSKKKSMKKKQQRNYKSSSLPAVGEISEKILDVPNVASTSLAGYADAKNHDIFNGDATYDAKQPKDCIVCWENPRSHMMSCGHAVLCMRCSKTWGDEGKSCPLCRMIPTWIVPQTAQQHMSKRHIDGRR